MIKFKTSISSLVLGALAALSLLSAGNSALAISVVQFNGRATLDSDTIDSASAITGFSVLDGFGDVTENVVRTAESSGIFSSVISDSFFGAFPLGFSDTVSPLFSFSAPEGDYFFSLYGPASVGPQDEGFLTIKGTGFITAPWGGVLPDVVLYLTSQGSPINGIVAISGSLETSLDSLPAVPEGGSAVMLLGLGMAGVVTLRHRFSGKAQA